MCGPQLSAGVWLSFVAHDGDGDCLFCCKMNFDLQARSLHLSFGTGTPLARGALLTTCLTNSQPASQPASLAMTLELAGIISCQAQPHCHRHKAGGPASPLLLPAARACWRGPTRMEALEIAYVVQ